MNGKDIKQVMNNAAHIFEELLVIMREVKRLDSILSNADVDAFCLHFGRCSFCGTGHFY